MRTQVSVWGNSIAVRVPKAAVEALDLKPGQTLNVAINAEGGLVLSPAPAPLRRYTHRELVEQMRAENQPRYMDWGLPVGEEIW